LQKWRGGLPNDAGNNQGVSGFPADAVFMLSAHEFNVTKRSYYMSVKSGNKQKNRNNVALSALALSLLGLYISPAHAWTIDPNNGFNVVDDNANGGGYLTVGSNSTSGGASTGSGSGTTPPPPSTNNGNGTTTLYNISAYGASNVTTTSNSGQVLLEDNGNITGTGGMSTTSSSVWDVASYIIVASSNVSQVLQTGNSNINMMNTTFSNTTGGGNLVMSGNGTFGGDLTVAGTIYGNGTDGALVLHGGTASTTITIDNSGITVADSGNGTTFTVSNNGLATAKTGFAVDQTSMTTTNSGYSSLIGAQDDIILNADSVANGGGGGDGGVIMQKNGTTLLSVGAGYGSNIDAYTTLDMHSNNITNVGTITATTGNITTINSTTINNSGNLATGSLNVNGASQMNGTLNVTGATTLGDTLTVAGATTLNGATTVNNSFTVDTNGGSANVTGTGRAQVTTNSAFYGVQNAGGGLNGITSNTTGTVVSGGTGTSTLTLQQNSAVLTTNANSSVSLSSSYADMYGYTESKIDNAYGSYASVNGNDAYLHGNSNAYVSGYYNADVSNAYGSSVGVSYGTAYVSGSNEAVVSGGGSSLTMNSNGATFAAEGTGNAIQVHGVAKGTAKTDAVNVSQLKAQYDSLAGGLSTMAAMNNIPQVDTKKTFAVGVGYGNYDSKSGYAIGGSYRFMEDGIIKASVGGSSDGETAWGVGAGFSW
jgi:hypothetical protein